MKKDFFFGNRNPFPNACILDCIKFKNEEKWLVTQYVMYECGFWLSHARENMDV